EAAMMDRRKLLGTIGAMAAGCCLCGGRAHSRPRLIGCFSADGRLTRDDIDQWTQHDPDPNVDSEFDVRGSDFGFPVDPAAAFYPDGNEPNAFATTVVWQRGRPDGTVVFGSGIARRLTARRGRYASTIVVAHEMAHILQFKRGFSEPGVRLETHADFMAG